MTQHSFAPRSRSRGRVATPLLVLGIAVGVVLAASGGVVLGLRSSNTSIGVGAPLVATPTSAPSDEAVVVAPSTSPAATPEGTNDGAPVPAYYVKDDVGGPRLYREFHTSTSTGSATARSLVAMIAKPSDPDYRNPWLGARLAGYSRKGPVATASFTGVPEFTSGDRAIAVQQVVYTVTAAEQDAALTVVIIADGKPLAAATPRADRAQVEGAVWLLTPTQNAKTAQTVALSGIASVFEATVSWDVRAGSPDGDVVASGSAQATAAAPVRAPWKASVTLKPGTYVVRAFAADESGGSEPIAEDTKQITVS